MKRIHTLFLAAAAPVAAGALLLSARTFEPAPLASPIANPAAAGEWKIDSVHSTVLFKINHVGASTSWGRFNDVKGKIQFDPTAPEKSAIDLVIKADSVDTNSEGRDKHVKGPDFFAVKEHPEITFKSKSVKKVNEHEMEVTGDLTFHGVTKPVTTKVMHVGSVKHPQMGELVGFDATFTIKRSDFGVTTYVKEKALGDEVTVLVSLEGAKS